MTQDRTNSTIWFCVHTSFVMGVRTSCVGDTTTSRKKLNASVTLDEHLPEKVANLSLVAYMAGRLFGSTGQVALPFIYTTDTGTYVGGYTHIEINGHRSVAENVADTLIEELE